MEAFPFISVHRFHWFANVPTDLQAPCIIDCLQYLLLCFSKVPKVFTGLGKYTVGKNRKKEICLLIKAFCLYQE